MLYSSQEPHTSFCLPATSPPRPSHYLSPSFLYTTTYLQFLLLLLPAYYRYGCALFFRLTFSPAACFFFSRTISSLPLPACLRARVYHIPLSVVSCVFYFAFAGRA